MPVTEATRLLPSERQQRILQLALDQGVLRIAELAGRFGVSEMTIRRDLEVLAEAGHIERRFGGAVVSEQAAAESSYQERLTTHAAEKRALARYAAGLVQDGDTVAIDASTTGLALARELARRRVAVVTNSLDCAQELRGGPAEVILIGGRLRRVAGSFTGPLALEALRHLRVDQTFLSAKGALVPDGLVDSDLDEIEVKRAMLRSAARVVALLDASKFGVRALGRIAPLDEVDLLVSDAGLAEATRAALSAYELELRIVEVEAS